MSVDYYWTIRNITTTKEMEKFIKREGVEAFSEYDWICILNSGTLTTDMVHRYRDHLDWDWMLVKMRFSIQFLEAHIDYLENAWGSISYFQKLSWSFIEKYKDKLNIPALLEHSDNLSSEDSRKVAKLYEKMNTEKNRKKWDKIKPGFLTWRERMEERKKAQEEALKPKKVKIEEPKKETQVKKEKEEKPKEVVVSKKRKKDFSKFSKDELKDYLKKRNVKYLYHDTKDTLIAKCEKVYYEGGENASSTRSKSKVRSSGSSSGRGSK